MHNTIGGENRPVEERARGCVVSDEEVLDRRRRAVPVLPYRDSVLQARRRRHVQRAAEFESRGAVVPGSKTLRWRRASGLGLLRRDQEPGREQPRQLAVSAQTEGCQGLSCVMCHVVVVLLVANKVATRTHTTKSPHGYMINGLNRSDWLG